MATKWQMKGKWVKNCNCAPGCPCDFWADPTHHECEGMLAMEVDQGHFGDTRLDGVRFAVTYHWPGPLHEGNGTAQPILDERTTAPQRDALFQILTGKAGNAWFELIPTLISTFHDPVFAPIRFAFDLKGRRARVEIPGVLETVTEPISNAVSGEEHHAQIQLPNGMEYKTAEIARATVNRGTGAIKYDVPGGHSSLAYVEHTQDGLMAERG
jgi:hypothetical protein